MHPGGWFFMIISWSVILALFAYSMFRTLTSIKQDSSKSSDAGDTCNN
jgi:uncharacterized membrane protein